MLCRLKLIDVPVHYIIEHAESVSLTFDLVMIPVVTSHPMTAAPPQSSNHRLARGFGSIPPLTLQMLQVLSQLRERLESATNEFGLDLEWSVDQCWCFRLVPNKSGSTGGGGGVGGGGGSSGDDRAVDRAVEWMNY